MQTHYNPNQLLDNISNKLNLKNDAALARTLEVTAPMISKVRNLRLPVGASLLIRMHEVTGLPVKELQNMMGDRREKFRLSTAQGRPGKVETISRL
jgi:plasmid maintenance system antidote protein VapI